MSAPPIVQTLRPEDYADAPDWALKMMESLNLSISQFQDALSRNITRNENMLAGSKADLPFTSAASGTTTVRVKTDLPFSPKHVNVSGLRKQNGTAITAAWSATSKPADAGSFDVVFQGLDASTAYFFNVLYE
jgi:hypothetical protein